MRRAESNSWRSQRFPSALSQKETDTGFAQENKDRLCTSPAVGGLGLGICKVCSNLPTWSACTLPSGFPAEGAVLLFCFCLVSFLLSFPPPPCCPHHLCSHRCHPHFRPPPTALRGLPSKSHYFIWSIGLQIDFPVQIMNIYGYFPPRLLYLPWNKGQISFRFRDPSTRPAFTLTPH